MFHFGLRSSSCLTVVFLLGVSSRVSAESVTEYSAGHTDLRIAFRGGELDLLYHFGEGAVLDGVVQAVESEGVAGGTYVRVADSTREIFGVPAPFLGTGPNDPVWRLPRANVSGLPFLGIATHELSDAGFANVLLTMTGFNGPGEFALYQTSLAGPSVFWQTNDGINEEDGDDELSVGILGHDHYNFGFTAEGIYDITLTASADFTAGGSVSDTETFRFLVGSATAIPEPGFASLLALSMSSLYLRRSRKSSPKLARSA